ncbi:MAG: hypothetical protein UR85_C0004G0061 [Candidatus Nomurabacteria bacterium GW2011_GWF2_35_66]|uniref:Uncharacterized protein n=1 Tax=Candidatus Nomurabacteria bacterium GW2011_GWE1_35_16 TaxID=1618761 RepID=A0A0G0BSY5_9BACT|nr:MAG: hypothetical protein UR55_C0002G0060 [Candidatus Nomurabacteria bacterium GW2011_GWF1_34_20]KKP63639.1 MAG: hypothetical protein UR57_C0002G0060 [Candidatus Nomurabacteria bacterium GW2011_GWE2_34_25]KKP66841.1 MAG: hypothetical protein UR64_C0002G0057 [Candidatus Nomurabacteria bacterium GW2011_GWE1_35_16]KKP83467.1 MAG: hypothetical protein UR85_C0004G0061 [Candidatus Nomurabacteria bacterium GW2011_GWF2_35_66]HAE36601.1 hypothetical protein [Candidatus Nomurabacteria bacterium]
MEENERFRRFPTTDNIEIEFDTADHVCMRFGFKAGETALHPKGAETVTFIGVAPAYGKAWEPALWYVIHHPSVKGKACCWGGVSNLLEAGFTRISA